MTIPDLFSVAGWLAVTRASSDLRIAFIERLAQADAGVVSAPRRPELLEQTRVVVEKAGRRALCVVMGINPGGARA